MDQETLTNESLIASPLHSAPQPLQQSARRLPVEILIEMFSLSLPPLNLAQAPQKTTLALVCRFWNGIVDSTPLLWSGISIADSISYIQKSLLKSEKHPLDVDGTRATPSNEVDVLCDGICCEFLEELIGHAGRWRHMWLQVSCEQYWHIESIATLPSLKTLELYWGDFLLRDEYLTLFNGTRSPSLVELSIHSPGIRYWHNISLPAGLSRLYLGGSFRRCPLLLKCLAACPNLTLLRLYDIVLPRSQGDDSDLELVELAALQQLDLFNVPLPLGRDLLKKLRLPAECIVSVKCTIPDPSPSTSFLTPALSHHGSFQNAENPGQATFTLVGRPRGFRLIVVCKRWSINLRLHRAEAVRDALEWFGISAEDSDASSYSDPSHTDSRTPNNASVMLELGKYRPNFNLHLLATISNFQCITKIKICHLSASTQASFLRYLSRPEDPDQPATGTADCVEEEPGAKARAPVLWPFPSLCEIVLKGIDADGVTGLIDAVQSRSGDGATTGGPRKPARLKRIEFLDEGDEPAWKGAHSLEGDIHDAGWSLMDILKVLDDDAELVWGGERIPKAGTSLILTFV